MGAGSGGCGVQGAWLGTTLTVCVACSAGPLLQGSWSCTSSAGTRSGQEMGLPCFCELQPAWGLFSFHSKLTQILTGGCSVLFCSYYVNSFPLERNLKFLKPLSVHVSSLGCKRAGSAGCPSASKKSHSFCWLLYLITPPAVLRDFALWSDNSGHCESFISLMDFPSK